MDRFNILMFLQTCSLFGIILSAIAVAQSLIPCQCWINLTHHIVLWFNTLDPIRSHLSTIWILQSVATTINFSPIMDACSESFLRLPPPSLVYPRLPCVRLFLDSLEENWPIAMNFTYAFKKRRYIRHISTFLKLRR